MRNNFLEGFVGELAKEAGGGHPMISGIMRTGTVLGQKVRGMVSKAGQIAQKSLGQAKRGAGLSKSLHIKKAEEGDWATEAGAGGEGEGDDADAVGRTLRALMQNAQTPSFDSEFGDYQDTSQLGPEDQVPSYGTGEGTPPAVAAKKAPSGPQLPKEPKVRGAAFLGGQLVPR